MFSRCSISEQVLSAEQDHQHMFANNLKRKLETGGRNGFVSSSSVDNELFAQRQDNCLTSEKRPRLSGHFSNDQMAAGLRISGNGELSLNYVQTKNNAVVYPGLARNGNIMGIDSLLQSNLEWKVSSDEEEITGMDVEGEMASCPPNLNVLPDAVGSEGNNSSSRGNESSSDENSPVKGSPAREFLQRHRPEYQMHCIPSYCHPGGLWDVMLEVYHGL